ncbi:MAG: two-component regulator propeller domain-containing protein [Paludibacter sp.]|nr:two-component regulator propeller domain-containing protein [Paludibacter sp.]
MRFIKLSISFSLLIFAFVQHTNAVSGIYQNEYQRPVSVVDGLVSNEVNCMLQDSKGFMWYGTNNGLCRYDAYTFKHYKSNYQHPLFFTSNTIRSLAEDQSGCLWVGTLKGLNKIDLQTGEVSHFNNEIISRSGINSIVIANDNTPYFGTTNGLFYFDRTKNDFVQITSDNRGREFKSITIRSLMIDSKNYMWIGTWETGFDVYNLNTNLFADYPYLKEKKLLIVNSFYEDDAHNIWLSTWDRFGVFRIENPHQPAQSRITVFYPRNNEKSNFYPVVYSINQDKNTGNIFLATSNGLQIIQQPYKYEDQVQLSPANSLKVSSDEIFSLYKDRTGLIWYSIYGVGVNAISSNREQFEQYNLTGLIDKENWVASITGIYEDENGLIWLGIKSFVLGLFDRRTNSLTLYNHHPVLKSIATRANSILSFHKPVKKDELWLGTRYDGLYIVSLNNGKIQSIRKRQLDGIELGNLWIKEIIEDEQNNIWVATSKGLVHLEWNGSEYIVQVENEIKNKLYNQIVNTLSIDHEKNIWVGTQDLGLFRIFTHEKPVRIEEYSLQNRKLNNNEVLSLLQDHKNRIWVGTKGGGLSLYDTKNNRFKIVDNMSLIPDDAIYSMEEDHWGNLWLATGNGLVSYNEDLPHDKKIRIFSGKEGIRINTFNPNAAFKNNNNELFFGGSNGFIAFVPEKNKEKSLAPQPVITGVSISNELIDNLPEQVKSKITKLQTPYSDKIVLAYNQKNILIEYSAMLFENISAIKYAYQLEGVDKDWVYVDSKKRFVNYNNLSPGTYVFKIKAANGDGVWCENPTTLKLKIKPAPWNTIYAYLAYLTIIIVLLIAFSRFIMNRVRLRKMLAIEQIEREKSEEVHQAKLKFFTNISHEFFTPITILSCALDGLRSRHPEEAGVMQNMKANMDRLVRLLEQIVEFRKVETGNLKLKVSRIEIVSFVKELCDVHFAPLSTQNNISLHFQTNKNMIEGYVDRDKLDKIMYNLLSNAFKYNRVDGSVNVVLEETGTPGNRKLAITVSDTGFGMSEMVKQNLFKRFYEGNFRNFKVKSIGIGLSLTHDLVKFHKGEITVDSTEGKGTIFNVVLPIEKEDYETREIFQNYDPETDEETLPENVDGYAINKNQEHTDPEKVRLLLVEDNLELIALIYEALKNDFVVYQAVNGEEALNVLYNKEVDIVVTDVVMPVMDGLELTSKMKSIVEFSHIPVLMLSARQNVENKVEGFDAGADSYITKPFEMPALVANIRSLVKNRKLLAQSFASDHELVDVSKYTHNATDKEFLEKVISIIEENVLRKNFTTNDLYFELNMSQSTFYRKLQSLINTSPNELIRKIKIQVACRLLLEKKLNISEVAYDLGFNDPKYFSSIFRKETGMSPTEYIKNKK